MNQTAPSTTVIYGIGPVRTFAAIAVLSLFAFWNHVVQESSDAPYSTPIELVGSDMVPCADRRDLAAHASTTRTVRLGFVGDIMEHRGQNGDDFSTCYEQVRPLLEGFDLAVGNLEFPVHPRRPIGPPAKSVQFNGSPNHIAALAEAGFDVLCTSNNHSFDQGLEGVVTTLDVLQSHGITAVGTAAEKSLCGPVVIECQGLRIAMVAYTMRPNFYAKDGEVVTWPRHWPVFELNFSDWSAEYRQKGQALFASHSEAARNLGADFRIALVHWGDEWHFSPTNDQRQAARDLVDAGFDLVVGGHSHVINPAELYRGKLIAYSLGNFISDFRNMETRLGAVLEVTVSEVEIEGSEVIDFRYYPILTERDGHRVRPLRRGEPGEGQRAWKLAERIFGSSMADFDDREGPGDESPVNRISRTKE